jgi:hypothetical protein
MLFWQLQNRNKEEKLSETYFTIIVGISEL